MSEKQLQLPFPLVEQTKKRISSPLASRVWIEKLPEFKTRKAINYHIRTINDFLPGGLDVIGNYIHDLREEGNLEDSSLSTYIGDLKRSVCKYLGMDYTLDLLTNHTVEQFFKSFNVKANYWPKPKVIPEESIALLIKEAPPRTAIWIKALYVIGRRVEELCGLERRNISLLDSKLARAQIRAKGGWKDEILIPRTLIEEINEVAPGKEHLIESIRGFRYATNSVSNAIAIASMEILGKPIRSHVMRHCFATYSVKYHFEKTKAIMRQGGWKDGNVFWDTYVEQEMELEDFPFMGQASIMQSTRQKIVAIRQICEGMQKDIKEILARQNLALSA